MTIALQTSGLTKTFGGLTATRGLDLSIARGARHALIGPNGAGKTTIVNLLSGVLLPDRGRIDLEGIEITRMTLQKRVALGLARTFQVSEIFAEMTPLESIGLAVAEHTRLRGGILNGWPRQPDNAPRVEELLRLFHLMDERHIICGHLSYGRQRLLEIALAVATAPRVLLLDEPMAGVPESERADILRVIASFPRDMTILLIEHDMDVVFSFAEKISVLAEGALLAEGTPAEVARDPRVRAVYLGEGRDD